MQESFEIGIINGRGVIKVNQNLLSEVPAEMLRSAYEELVERGQKNIVIDLTQTIAINSYGLGRILVLLKELTSQGGNLVVRVGNGYVKEIIKVLLLDKVIPLEEV